MSTSGNGFWATAKANRLASSLMIMATLAVGILMGTLISSGVHGKESSKGGDATPLQIPAPQQLSNAFSQISKQLEPSVVNINTESTIKTPHVQMRRRGQAPQGPDGQDPFGDFFDRFFGGQGGQGGQGGPGGPETQRERSLGSGVIVDSKGYILTNRHVIDGADRIRVHLMDDPPLVQHEAKLIGQDEETDLAVIKIDVDKTLPIAKLGNSDSSNVGDWVLAIGSPFGLQQTVTAGIISAKQRNLPGGKQFQSFLQTDAAINPGNSGGPLVNMAGEVVGINTAIYTETNSYAGIGFAMPSNTVVNVYNQLIAPDHRVARGSIGVQFTAQDNPAVARVYGGGSGVTIAQVTAGGPAERAGLLTGDTIVSVDGKEVKNGDDLVSDVSARKPGSTAKVGYMRNGKRQEATVTIADRAKLFASNKTADDSEDSQTPKESKLGIGVHNITPAMAEKLELPAGKGVAVTDVKPGSFAEDIQLNRGDVILEVNKQSVNSEEEFAKIESTLKSGQDVVMLVRPRGSRKQDGPVFLGGTLQ